MSRFTNLISTVAHALNDRLALILGGAIAVTLAVHSVASAQTLWNLREDFWYYAGTGHEIPTGNTTQNEWSYGSGTATAFTEFFDISWDDIPEGGLFAHRDSANTGSLPAVAWHSSAWYADAPPTDGYVWAHPGDVPLIVRWTAPATGDYSLIGDFLHPNTASSSNQNVGIVLVDADNNELALLNDTYIGNGQPEQPQQLASFSINSFSVQAGDTVNFYVAQGTDGFGSDGTGLRATIAPAAAPGVSGDYDNDGNVDGDDLAVWKTQFGQAVPPAPNADGNQDGMIGGADFLVWQRNFPWPAESPIATSIPEPASGALLLCGAAIILRGRWRRESH